MVSKEKDVILFVNAVRPLTIKALEDFEKVSGRKFTPVILVDEKIKDSIFERNAQHKIPADKVVRLVADFDSAKSVRKALKPYMDRIFAVTSQFENSVLELKKLIPYLPDLQTPSEKSLEWATEKSLMRELLESHNPDLAPLYKEVTDSSATTLKDIESTMHFPMIVKPSGLEGSLLVTKVHNHKELQETLKRTLKEMQKAYDTWLKRQKPVALVEEFMEGGLYSIDIYISQDGTCHFTPPIHVITGDKIGFDDFFEYMATVPTDLSEKEIAAAYDAAEQACHALALRSVTAHVELIRTPHGWKIVELGPRIGGYRHEMYTMSYGINHIVNDILNRAGEKPHIPPAIVGHVAVFDIYADEEGIVEAIHGIEDIKKLASYVSLDQKINVGEHALFAKNNGNPALGIMLHHEDKEQFLTDVKAMENVLKIIVKPVKK